MFFGTAHLEGLTVPYSQERFANSLASFLSGLEREGSSWNSNSSIFLGCSYSVSGANPRLKEAFAAAEGTEEPVAYIGLASAKEVLL